MTHTFGFIDRSGELVNDLAEIPNSTTALEGELFPFSCDRALVFSHSSRDQFLFVRRDSTRLTRTFPNARSFSQGLAAVCLAEEPQKWGYIDVEGNIVIKPRYQEGGPFSDGLAAVKLPNQEKWQFIDRAGNIAISGPFDDVGKFSCGLAAVKAKGQWGFIDKSGKYVIQPNWHKVGDYHEGIVWLETNSMETQPPKRVYMDTKGVLQFECSAKNWLEDPFLHQPVTASLPTGKFGGCYDQDVSALPFIENGDYSEGLIVRQFGEKFGYCDQRGRLKIAPLFDYAWRFSDGRALIYKKQDKGLFGYIDKSGIVVIKPQFKQADHFSEGFAVVGWHDKSSVFFIDKYGHEAFHGRWFRKAARFSSGRAAVGEFKPVVY